MDIFGGITNPNTIITASATSTAISSAICQAVFITIPNWPANSIVTNIKVAQTNSTPSAITASIYEGAADTTIFANLIGDISLTFDSQKTASASISSTVINPNKCNSIQVSLHTTSVFVQGTVFTVTLMGHKTQIDDVPEVDSTPWSGDKFTKILTYNGTNQTMTDITKNMLNGWINTEDTRESITVCDSASGYLYIGTTTPLPTLYFSVDSTTLQTETTTADIEYLSTSNTWISLRDSFINALSISSSQKPSGGVYGYSSRLFEYGGLVDFISVGTTPALTQLNLGTAIDPGYTLEQSIIAGTTPPLGMFYNPNRYWLKISFPGVFKLYGIKVLA
jgi:hypothetical protein